RARERLGDGFFGRHRIASLAGAGRDATGRITAAGEGDVVGEQTAVGAAALFVVQWIGGGFAVELVPARRGACGGRGGSLVVGQLTAQTRLLLGQFLLILTKTIRRQRC